MDSAAFQTIPEFAVRLGEPYCEGAHAAVECQTLGRIQGAFVARGDVLLFGTYNGLTEFDSAGHYVRDVGSLGAGPGQYQHVHDVAEAAAGGLRIFDSSNDRFTLIHGDGSATSVWARQERGSVTLFLPGRAHGFGLRVPDADSVGAAVTAQIGQLSDQGRFEPVASVRGQALRNSGNWLIPERPLFVTGPLWAIGPDDGIIYAAPVTAGAVRIESYTSTGLPRWVLRGTLPTRPVTQSEVPRAVVLRVKTTFNAQYARTVLDACATGNRAACDTFHYFERLAANAPRVHPAVTRIRVLSDSTIWLRLVPDSLGRAVEWLALDASGQPASRVTLPADADVRGGRGRALLIATSDSADGVHIRWAWLGASDHSIRQKR